jgi:hypothetical protein
MKISTIGVLSVVGVAISTPLWAGPVGIQRSLTPDQQTLAISELQAKKSQVARQMPVPPKGPAMARYLDRVSTLNDLIDRLQAGQSVSPDEIDQALQGTVR